MSLITLITGGSRGIGAATAQLLAAQGHAVAINYAREAGRADALAALIRSSGGRAMTVQADVSQQAEVERMYARIDSELGTVTGLVNSAGVTGATSRVQGMEQVDLERLLGINVVGTLLCAREAVRRMSTAGGGHGGAIVNMSSVAARLGAPHGGVHYAASKGAVDALTFGLAQEVAAEGIRVNAVRPGVIDTEMQPAGRVADIGPKLPMGRAGRAEEVAEVIAWLLADAASYVTGSVVDVAGAR